ncbi:MAG: hypothetical protein AAF561_09845 [Planctomycetota bacterium]
MSDTNTPVVTLVGHCGPDSSFLRMAVSSAAPGATVTMADTNQQLADVLENGSDLLLFNRVLESGFDDSDGVALLKQTKAANPGLKVLMVSNFPQTQQEAEAAGAVEGFGKNDISSGKASERIKAALEAA